MKPEKNTIPESTFKTFFTKHNNDFHTYGFKEWIFYPGMLFQDREAWWVDNGLRAAPHEGIDLCFYRDKTGQVRRIGEGTKIDNQVHLAHNCKIGKGVLITGQAG